MNESENPLSLIKNHFSIYDSFDLLRTAAALQLEPINAGRAIRLEIFSHISASIQYSDSPKLRISRIKEILNSYPFAESEIERFEDPTDNLFSESFSFHGGSYIVFPGITEDASFNLRQIALALNLDSTLKKNGRFVNDANFLIHSVLSISNEIARRSNIQRGVESDSEFRGKVAFPSNLAQLKNAVTFNQNEILSLTQSRENIPKILRQIITKNGFSYDRIDFSNGELFRKPIVQFDSEYVVAIPSALLTAARHQIIKMALEEGIIDSLVKGFSDIVWSNVIESFTRLQNTFISYNLPPSKDLPSYYQGLFQLDTDKVIYAGLLIDPFENYDIDNPFGFWESKILVPHLIAQWQTIERMLYDKPFQVSEWLCIFILGGIGRNTVIGFNRTGTISNVPFIHLSASDLETISWLEPGDSLLLWQYAVASERVRDTASILSLDQLGEFHMYRKNRNSYYFSDKGRPNSIAIEPGGAGEIRREVAIKRDSHAVESFEEGYISEVTALHGTKKVPIYIADESINGDQIAILVETPVFPLWVLSPNFSKNNQKRLRGRYFSFVESISHWLWQLTPELIKPFEKIRDQYRKLLFHVFLEDSDQWFNLNKDQRITSSIEISVDANIGSVNITINTGIIHQLSRSDNEGERYLMNQILKGLRSIIDDSADLSDDAISRAIEKHMPTGLKKKIILLDAHQSPELDTEGIPKEKINFDSDVEMLLDDVGEFLIKEKLLPIGKILDIKRTEVFQYIVGYFYAELERLVSTLNSSNLMEWLIAHNEAVISDIANYRLTIPTRLACFISEKELIEELEKKGPRITSMAVASRFLIEYVSAKPPKGLRPISRTAYNRMLALAGEIFEFGMESDLIHFAIADFTCSILPSRRFGANRANLARARDAYSSIYNEREIKRFSNEFESFWREVTSGKEKPEDVTEIDMATKIEFGYELTEIILFLGETYNFSMEKSWHGVGVLSLTEFTQILSSRLDWKRERVMRLIELLSLQERKNFLNPPVPFKVEDVYPWRYNRPVSYIRRPFILRNVDKGTEILWGPRNLHMAWTYLVDLCLNGRLQANSIEMRQFLGKINDKRGSDFNKRVYEWFSASSKLVVKYQVKKIGNKRMVEDGKDLGDIDVLAVDKKKKNILLFECKSLALARTPNELSNELETLFKGNKNKKSAIQKHAERAKWIKENIKDVLKWVDLQHKGKWKVETKIVVDVPLFTPHLTQSPMDVISFGELSKKFPQYAH